MPSDWSPWEWNETLNRWACYRLDSNGEYEYEYKYENSINESTEQASSYPSSTVPAPQSSVDDLNEQYGELDIGAGNERGRKKSRENQPRDPTVSPTRPPKPGPKPPPFPSTQHSSSSYESSDVYYGSAYGVSETSPISPVYSDIPAEQYGSSYGGGYDKRSYEPSSSQEYHPEEILVTIKKKSLRAMISSSKESLISSEMVDILKLEKKRIKSPWWYRDEYEIKDRVKVTIETGGAKLKDATLFVLTRKCPLENPVVLGTDILGVAGLAASDYRSSKSIGSGYSESSRPYTSSSYSTEGGRPISHGASASDCATDDEYGVHEPASSASHDQQNPALPSTGPGFGEGGMYNLPADGNYSLHSNNNATNSAYTPRPSSPCDETQQTYSATNDTLYAVAH